jgi:hypothetical protein
MAFLKHNNGENVASEMNSLLSEIFENWSRIEKILDSKTVVLCYDIHRNITLLLEAWNAAIVFATHEHDKQWKGILLKQVKQAKKCISKTNGLLVSESLPCLEERMISVSPHVPVCFIFT